MDCSSSELTVASSDKLPQMDTSHYFGRGWTGLSELMRAIILRTVDDYNSSGELKVEALEYMEDTEEEYIFSFRAICHHLDLDPDKTREAIINPKHRISTRRRAA